MTMLAVYHHICGKREVIPAWQKCSICTECERVREGTRKALFHRFKERKS